MRVELQFTVGRRPSYGVQFTPNKFWGRTRITVDGQTVFKQNLPLEESLATVKRHHLNIDEHEVVIEIERKSASPVCDRCATAPSSTEDSYRPEPADRASGGAAPCPCGEGSLSVFTAADVRSTPGRGS